MKKILLLLLILSSNVVAKNLGQVGEVFPITEEDALTWLMEKRLPELQADGSIARLEKQLQEKAKTAVAHPKGITLPKTTKPKQWLRDLTVYAPQDFKDPKGRVVLKKGTPVNPLTRLPNSQKQMVFVDGTDPEQMRWSQDVFKKNPFQTRIVLTNGPIETLTEQYDMRFFFDQSGRMIQYFGITQLPATVKRHGDKLLISEVLI